MRIKLSIACVLTQQICCGLLEESTLHHFKLQYGNYQSHLGYHTSVWSGSGDVLGIGSECTFQYSACLAAYLFYYVLEKIIQKRFSAHKNIYIYYIYKFIFSKKKKKSLKLARGDRMSVRFYFISLHDTCS